MRRSCAIYARFSSERQREESIEDQVRVCREWARREGWEVAEVYADRHISGRTDKRPEFRRMVSDAARADWGAVVVYKLDRFARSRADASRYRARLRAEGKRLISATESIPDSPEGIIMESVLEGFAEYYSASLSQNVRRGLEGNAMKRKANGVQVLGYRTAADGTYELDPVEAPIVAGIFERMAAGVAKADVRDWANGQGLRTRRGGMISYDVIRRMVADERYRGVYHFGDVREEGGMPRIVDDETWYEAGGRHASMPRKNAFPLSGRLYDKATGRAFRGTGGTSGTGRRYLYYSVPVDGGGEWRVAKELVESTVMDALAQCFAEEETRVALAEFAHEAMVRASGADTDALEERLAELSKANDNILRAIERGIVPDGAKERLDAIRRERADVERRLSIERAEVPSVEELEEFVATQLYRQDPERLMRHAISRVEVDRETGDVKIKIPWQRGVPEDSEAGSEVLRSRVWWTIRDHGRTVSAGASGIVVGTRLVA